MLIYRPTTYSVSIHCRDKKHHEQKMRGVEIRTAEEELIWRYGYKRWIDNGFSCECVRVRIDPFMPSMPPFSEFLPPPGFFVGNYGAKGTKMVKIRYQKRSPSWEGNDPLYDLEGIIMTGDITLPRYFFDFRAFLNEPSFSTMRSLNHFEPIDAMGCRAKIPTMPFNLPPSMPSEYLSEEIPKQYCGQFRAHGLRPYDDDRHFHPAQLVVFNPDCFGILGCAYRHKYFLLFVRRDIEP